MHTDLSDRAIAAVVGLSPPTVGAIRRRATAGDPQSNTRVGRDGRVRPLNAVDGRLRVSEIVAARPDASLREIAREANVSVSTARDVRQRIRRGEDPVPNRSASVAVQVPSPRGANQPRPLDRGASALDLLRKDPSLRFTDAGRRLLQWMGVHTIHDEPERVVNAVPAYCTEIAVALARRCAEAWTRLGNDLEERARDTVTWSNHGPGTRRRRSGAARHDSSADHRTRG